MGWPLSIYYLPLFIFGYNFLQPLNKSKNIQTHIGKLLYETRNFVVFIILEIK